MERHTSIDINKIIAKSYIFLLTVRMISPLLSPLSVFHGATIYFDFLIHMLGLVLVVVTSRGKLFIGSDYNTINLLKRLLEIVIYFCVSSVIMAFVIQMTLGNYADESAFSGIVGQIIYYIQYLLIVIYNINIFRILSKDEIDKILGKECVFLLVLGYYQILCYSIGGAFVTIGNSIDVFKILFPDSTMAKLSLTASEGAKAGGVVGILVLPYLFTKAIMDERPIRYYIQVVLWIPVIVFMQSTAAYLAVIAVFIAFVFTVIRSNGRNKKRFVKYLLVLVTAGVFIVNFVPETVLSSFLGNNNVSYLVLQKLSDTTNGSTMLRIAPLIINWKVFLKYPIFGIGNGLQGYFYTEFFPREALSIAGVLPLYEVATRTIVNGSLFFPSILSGYGIVGTVFAVLFIIKMFKILEGKKDSLGIFYTIFKLSTVAIFLHGFQTEFSGSYYIWFILSIPFMPINDELTNDP